jgi:hypothetical protein
MKYSYPRMIVATAENKMLIFTRAFGQRLTYVIRRGLSASVDYLRKSIGIVLILSLFATSTPAAPQTVVALAKESGISFAFWFHASGWRKMAARLIEGHNANGRGQEKQRHRDDKVARIQIFPGNVTVDISEHVWFAALAYDRYGNPVGGVNIKWSGQSSVPDGRVRISKQGEFEATTPGSFNIVAEGAGKTASASIVVRPGTRRTPNLTAPTKRQVSTRDLPSPVATKSNSLSEGVAQHSKKGPGKTKGRDSVLRAHTKRSNASPPSGISSNTPAVLLLPGDGWDETNYWSADDPGNRVGDPPGAPMDEGVGSANFQMAAPVLGLPGRGIDLSLGLAYNSRLWNKAGSQISFDNDRGWPAPGFSLGFGKLLGMGGGSMLIDADGTRHAFIGNVSPPNSFPQNFAGHTTDGTFIDYSHLTNSVGWIIQGQAKLANGTIIDYGANGTACCEQTSFNYTVDTQYAYPLSQTRGSATDALAQVTTSATYDFNTGLALSATDANGRVATTSYHAPTIRQIPHLVRATVRGTRLFLAHLSAAV